MANCVAEIAVRVRPLSPGDSLARAAELVRTSPGGTAPVQQDGQIIGIVSADRLADWVAERGVEAARGASVLEVTQPAPDGVRGDATVLQALEQLRQAESPAAPVVDAFGRYLGMVGRGELLSASMGALRPPLIGGMATPFGVYLTDGTRRGGVGDAALVSTGVFLGLVLILSSWLGYRGSLTAMGLLERIAPAWAGRLFGGFSPIMPPELVYVAFTLFLFALMFRFSRVTGYHAAEHQVVHAIEQGDDLRAEVVREKPRVHPRCGTNLMAAFGVFTILERWGGPLAFVGALVLWRFFGSFLQQYVTTRPARGGELDSGLVAGRQLLERYQGGVGKHVNGWRRFWNMGMLQVFFGWCLVWGLLILAHQLLLPGSPEAAWYHNYWGS